MTDGFEVFVQLVIAAITTLPCFSADFTSGGTCSSTLGSSTPTAAGLPPSASQLLGTDDDATAAFAFINEGSARVNDSPAFESATRSCGRLGPARLGSTEARSRLSNSEYSASGVRAS